MNRNIKQNRRIQEARIQKQLNEAASGVKFKCLFEKTDFVITDQIEYNFTVHEIAAESLYSEHNRLFCNVHPTLIFNSVFVRQLTERECVGRQIPPTQMF